MKSNAQLLSELGIDLHRKSSGQVKTQCPFCTPNRKNKKDPCLSVNIDEGVYNCHHCAATGKVFEKRVKEYVRPVPRLEKLQPEYIKWFEKTRGISNNTLLRFNITEALEWMPKASGEVSVLCFNYYRGDDLVNIKYRGKNKDFKLAKDAELIFYNLNALKDSEEVVIVEGEIDCLAMYEAGIYNCISVPNGASKGSQKLEYLDNCYDWFKSVKKVIIATDNDEAGLSLRDELARRLDKERCYKVHYPEGCKDANEVLLKHGKEALSQMISSSTQWPIEGVITMDEMYDEICSFYENGYPQGIKAGIPGFDDLLSFKPGQFTTITGSPSSGKSEFTDNIIAHMIKNHQWGWVICSFENQPTSLHATKIMEKLTGKAFGFRRDPLKRMSPSEFQYGVGMVDVFCHFINIRQTDLSLIGLLEKCRELVRRKGVKGILIDPWNYIQHKQPDNKTETQYINDCLTEIKVFCEVMDVHLFLIAHPTKLRKEGAQYEVATMYQINGSAHFYNKTDNGISVFRDRQRGVVDVHVQKVRYSWLGREDVCSFRFDLETRQYIPILK